MKFLLFNVAVAAALAFLFTADRGDVQKIAGQVHDAAGNVKDYANKALNAGETILQRDAVMAEQKTQSAPIDAPPLPVAQPVAPPVSQPAAQPAAPAPAALPKPASQPRLSPQIASNLPELPELVSKNIHKARPKISKTAVANLDPAVAKRRKEVLGALDAPNAAPALKKGSQLMTPSERRKELLSLAEEMELLYARSISQ